MAPDLIIGPHTERGHEERGRISRGISERDDRGERTPKAGVDGSPAPREKGLCRPVEKEESAGWEAARSFEAMRPGRAGSISEIPDKKFHVIEGSNHMQLYDVPKYVDEAVSVLAPFFKADL